MNGVIEKTERVFKELAHKKLAVGVSGGRDSMCLLHALISSEHINNADITVVHVNHCLRKTADDDERFVAEFCKKHGLLFRAFRVDVKAESAKKSLTIEQAARNLRYDALHSLISSGEAEKILTAHHALDNAESVLMHLFRGAGIDGLCGMASEANAFIVRPLLNVYPSELDEYAQKQGIQYVVDETNCVDDADRNFIRLNVLPLIEQRYSGAVRSINALSDECEKMSEYLNGLIDDSLIGHDRGAVTVSDKALLSPLAGRYVKKAMSHFSVVDVTRLQISSAAELVNKPVGSMAELAGGVKAVREYGLVAFYIPREECEMCVPLNVGANFIDGLAVDVELSDADPSVMHGCCVDLDKIDGGELRFRREGDMFTPYGGKRKKLKQYFIDKKIPKRLRDRIPLVCKGDEVLVAVGIEVSEKVKQDENTVRRAVVKSRW